MAKLTVEMNDEMNKLLGEVAHRRGVPKTAALRRAVALMSYLDEAADRGETVVIRNPESKTEREIVFESNV